MESLKNVSVQKLGEMLKDNKISHQNLVEGVADLFVEHYGADFNCKYDFELNRVLVGESILCHHGQLFPNIELGLYALRLLKLAQEGKLRLSFSEQNRLSPLLIYTENN